MKPAACGAVWGIFSALFVLSIWVVITGINRNADANGFIGFYGALVGGGMTLIAAIVAFDGAMQQIHSNISATKQQINSAISIASHDAELTYNLAEQERLRANLYQIYETIDRLILTEQVIDEIKNRCTLLADTSGAFAAITDIEKKADIQWLQQLSNDAIVQQLFIERPNNIRRETWWIVRRAETLGRLAGQLVDAIDFNHIQQHAPPCQPALNSVVKAAEKTLADTRKIRATFEEDGGKIDVAITRLKIRAQILTSHSEMPTAISEKT